MYSKMLPLNRSSQDLSDGILYFIEAWNFIDFDKLFLWYYTSRNQKSDHNPNQNQISKHMFHQFILNFGWNLLMYYDVVVQK